MKRIRKRGSCCFWFWGSLPFILVSANDGLGPELHVVLDSSVRQGYNF